MYVHEVDHGFRPRFPFPGTLHTARDVRKGIIRYEDWLKEIWLFAHCELTEWQDRNKIDDAFRFGVPDFLDPTVHDSILNWEWNEPGSLLLFVDFRKYGFNYRWVNPNTIRGYTPHGIENLPDGFKRFHERALWKERTGADRDLTVIEFIRKHYAMEIAENILSRPLIRHEDVGLYIALSNFLRTHDLPGDLQIPTKSQILSDLIAEHENIRSSGNILSKLRQHFDPEVRELIRLHDVARKRPK